MNEERFAEIARKVMAETLHAEFVAFNEQMMDYVTRSEHDILKAIKELRHSFALVGGDPHVTPLPIPQEKAEEVARTKEALLQRLGSYASGDYDSEEPEDG